MLVSNPKTKIGLFLDVTPESGGMYQYAISVLDSLKRFDKSNYELIVLYSDHCWKDILGNDIKSKYSKLSWLSNLFAKLCNTFFLPSFITKRLGIINPQVIQMLKLNCDIWIFPGQDLQTFFLNSKVIGTIHDLMHRYERTFPESGSIFRYYLRENRYKNILRSSSAVLVDSEFGKFQVIESYNIRPEIIRSLPYIRSKYLLENIDLSQFENTYKLPKKFIFYPAQFWLHKNHIQLIKAIKHISKTHPDIHLVLLGSYAKNFISLKKLVEELGIEKNIEFLGYVPNNYIRGFYLKACALVYPSFYGPTNIPPLEAIALNCIPIVSNVYGMKEQLGDCALYFNPNDHIDIANQIIKAWVDEPLRTDLLKRIAAKNRDDPELIFYEKLKEIIDDLVD